MEKLAELTGEEREKHIAELKRKMQEAAKKAKAAAGERATAAPARTGAPAPVAAASAPKAAEAVAEASVASAPPIKVAEEPLVSASSGVAVAPAPKPTAVKPAVAEPEAEAVTSTFGAAMNRREFLTYAWGAALGLLTIEAGVVSFFFLYPRFRAGEFGGKFYLPPAEVPPADAAPKPYSEGKFWLVTTAEGSPKALYMVCTHLGCLYKWAPTNNRFECPCHGSKFTHDGLYIEGPAPRSLDSFPIAEENSQLIVDTGKKILGSPSTESPFRAVRG